MPVLDPRSVKTLNGALPRGWLAKAAKRLGGAWSPGHISNVKNGRHENQRILNVLLGLAKAEARRRERLVRTINKLSSAE